MKSDDIAKQVDGIYKNILDKFNPGARQLITAGKGYLKSMHASASSSRLFVDALTKLALNAQQSGITDVGSALLNIVNVYNELQELQMNILKAFYVDLLVPLETNLEKDTKVVQHELKIFFQQHKMHMESYQKTMSTMKKQRRKKETQESTQKELKALQMLEEQKKKLDLFCDESFKNAIRQERRRYGFVLERQCSIAKHWMVYYTTGKNFIENNFSNWCAIASSREIMPENVTGTMASIEADDGVINRSEHSLAIDNNSKTLQLKKSRSVDASCVDMPTLQDGGNNIQSENSLLRSKSEFLLTPSNDYANDYATQRAQRVIVKALYTYMSSGENQLSFEEGDRIALVGGTSKGWQFGENLQTHQFGWFPIAYTNNENNQWMRKKSSDDVNSECYDNMPYDHDVNVNNGNFKNNNNNNSNNSHNPYEPSHVGGSREDLSTYRKWNKNSEDTSTTRMFGDTINFRNQKKQPYRAPFGNNPHPGQPPKLPAPVPMNQNRTASSSDSFSSANDTRPELDSRKLKAINDHQEIQPATSKYNHRSQVMAKNPLIGKSNSKLTANDPPPPPQPEVDYSDEEQQPSHNTISRYANDNAASYPRKVASWTLRRNIMDGGGHYPERSMTAMKEYNGKPRYNLLSSDDELLQSSGSTIKRTKSFWKFGAGRSEDIMVGMSLWQHRDLITPVDVEKPQEPSLEKNQRKIIANNQIERKQERGHGPDNVRNSRSQSKQSNSSSNERHHQQQPQQQLKDSIMTDEEEILNKINVHAKQPKDSSSMHEKNFSTGYTPKSRMKIMKTIEIDIENPTAGGGNNNIGGGGGGNGVSRRRQDNRDVGMLLQMGDGISRMAAGSREIDKIQPIDGHMHGGRYKSPAQIGGDEGEESDDNSTLKMSETSNFFDGTSRDMVVGGGVGGGDGAGRGNNSSGGGGGGVMKAIKRRDILKQYCHSEDDDDDNDDNIDDDDDDGRSHDVDVKSISSDPYDCIVIDDHLVRRKDDNIRFRNQKNLYQERQMEFHTFRTSSSSSYLAAAMNQPPQSTTSQNQRQSAADSVAGGGFHSDTAAANKMQKDQTAKRFSGTGGSNNNNSSTLKRNSKSDTNSNTLTATILPRTRLKKYDGNNGGNFGNKTLERNTDRDERNSGDKEKHSAKAYGPWYDFWAQ